MREKYDALCAQIGLGQGQADGYWPHLTDEEKQTIGGEGGNPIQMRYIMKNVNIRMRDGKATSEEIDAT